MLLRIIPLSFPIMRRYVSLHEVHSPSFDPPRRVPYRTAFVYSALLHLAVAGVVLVLVSVRDDRSAMKQPALRFTDLQYTRRLRDRSVSAIPSPPATEMPHATAHPPTVTSIPETLPPDMRAIIEAITVVCIRIPTGKQSSCETRGRHNIDDYRLPAAWRDEAGSVGSVSARLFGKHGRVRENSTKRGRR